MNKNRFYSIVFASKGKVPLRPLAAIFMLLFSLESGIVAQDSRETLISSDMLIEELQFFDQDLGEIICALGASARVSFWPDETVTQRVSYFFTDVTYAQVFERLQREHGLFFTEDGSGYRVSQIGLSVSDEGLYNLDCGSTALSVLVPAILSHCDYDFILPDFQSEQSSRISIHNVPFQDLLNHVLCYSGYSVQLDGNLLRFHKNAPFIEYEILLISTTDKTGISGESLVSAQLMDESSTDSFVLGNDLLQPIQASMISGSGYVFSASAGASISGGSTHMLTDSFITGRDGERVSFANGGTVLMSTGQNTLEIAPVPGFGVHIGITGIIVSGGPHIELNCSFEAGPRSQFQMAEADTFNIQEYRHSETSVLARDCVAVCVAELQFEDLERTGAARILGFSASTYRTTTKLQVFVIPRIIQHPVENDTGLPTAETMIREFFNE